jgi:hypothetical protein
MSHLGAGAPDVEDGSVTVRIVYSIPFARA